MPIMSAFMTPGTPILLSTWSFGLRGHAAAWPVLEAGGHAIDAVVDACTAIEADPEVDSVGYGGLPDRDGQVTLDACVMQSPSSCGSVCCLRHHLHAARIAREIMDSTSHVMLVGEAADAYADAVGEPRENLLSPEAAKAWESWKRDGTDVDQVRDAGRPVDQGGGRLFDAESRWAGHDTIGTLALDSMGVLAGACSTSGSPWKLPGRVGDSPIVGHGLYVDPDIGAVTATGTGELVMGVCGAMLGVEEMRRGADPTEALVTVLQRIESAYELEDNHQVGLVAIRRDGRIGSASLRGGFKVGYTSIDGDEVRDPEHVSHPGESG
ncbi:MAG: glycosylasparaginase [Phycisphaerae bacterium]|nr:glycosylasparaginase [Phycisphaerae bacterium]